MKLSTIALRNLSRNRRRSVLSAVAIAVAAAAISFLFALLAGYSADIEYNLKSYYSGAVRLRNPEYNRYDYLNPLHLAIPGAGSLVEELEERPGVRLVSPRIPFPAALIRGEERHQMSGLGMDISRARDFEGLDGIVVAGRLPENGAREAALGAGLADRIGLGLGDTLTVLTTTKYRGTNAMSFEVVGILGYPVAAVNVTRLVVPLEAAQRLTRMNDEVTEILLKLEPGRESVAFAASLEESLRARGNGGAAPLVAEPWQTINASFEMVETAKAAYNVIGLFFVILGSTVVINTTMMVIYERLREIGTLAALGMDGGRLVRLFFLESLFLAILGALAGVALGTGVAWPLSVVGINLGSMMEGIDFEISTIVRPEVTLYSTIVVFLGTVALASLATLLVTRKVSRIDPVEALSAP